MDASNIIAIVAIVFSLLALISTQKALVFERHQRTLDRVEDAAKSLDEHQDELNNSLATIRERVENGSKWIVGEEVLTEKEVMVQFPNLREDFRESGLPLISAKHPARPMMMEAFNAYSEAKFAVNKFYEKAPHDNSFVTDKSVLQVVEKLIETSGKRNRALMEGIIELRGEMPLLENLQVTHL